MITIKEALKIVLLHSNPLGIEDKITSDVLGCVLAEDIYSDIDIPSFNRSAMDGFAVNSKDPSKIFEVIEDISAGSVPQKAIKFGECARIMTGAMVPKGADKVIKVEDTRKISNVKIQITKGDSKLNVSEKGEDVGRGEKILSKGTIVRPQEIAMLATVGKTKVKVFQMPKIAVISTGSELVESSQKPKLGQIRNSNGPMLLAQLKIIGINGKYLGIVRDNFALTVKLIKKGLAGSDILILSGGVSVGDYDFVKEALKKCGVKIHFDKIAIKPGKPTVFGIFGKKIIFGLPGNPVSVLITFELLVVPAIDKIVGRKTKVFFQKNRLLSDFSRRDTKREQYFPIVLTEKGIKLVSFHGSGHMQALTIANGVMQIKKGIRKIKKGTIVNVRSI